ncbi:MAG: sporulation protein YqfD [Erysipelotrichales bacterium]|nr:sporulation protein YqfD [Erysipelotrichales bacterium]
MKWNSYDAYTTTLTIPQLLQLIKTHHLQIRNLIQQEEHLYFEASIQSHYKLSKVSNIQYLYTTGILGTLKRTLSNTRNYYSILACILSLFLYTHTLWDIQFKGEDQILRNKILEVLQENDIYVYKVGLTKQEILAIEESLKEEFFEEIEWLNITKQGGMLSIQFIERKEANIYPTGYEPLAATKDAVIAYFEVESGKKLVKMDQYVNKGDILVTSEVVDSKGEIKHTYVRGKVYGYTQYYKEVNIPVEYTEEYMKPLAFLKALLTLRNEISKEITPGEYIQSENILQFSLTQGTIVMKIQYTLYEDITRI